MPQLTLSDLPRTLVVDVFEVAFDPMDQAALRATCTAALEGFADAAVGDDRRKLPAFLTTSGSLVADIDGTPTVDCPLRIAPAACGSPRRTFGHPPATAAREGATSEGALSRRVKDPLAVMVRTSPHPASGLQRPVRRCEELRIRVFDYGVFGQRAVHSRSNDPVLRAIPEPVVDALQYIAFRRLRIVVDDPSGESWAKICACFTGGHAGSVSDQCHEIVFATPSANGCLLAIAENSFARIPELRTIRFDHQGNTNGPVGEQQPRCVSLKCRPTPSHACTSRLRFPTNDHLAQTSTFIQTQPWWDLWL